MLGFQPVSTAYSAVEKDPPKLTFFLKDLSQLPLLTPYRRAFSKLNSMSIARFEEGVNILPWFTAYSRQLLVVNG
ncbi:MAG: hypothetical protein A2898_00905 [Candidatus Kerfeldbacteria bacterium RIFCSPLOWO2_01_FULL_48_11]|uniref:Uncharacterized protein n=1 Tax=Candidatus Kerfeldbacteria bacterium RIFCSPLOWO2_01_FULL_48_11 TaxID=1798543 RepID=A0A1G2B682_9BACT|nr:MAG: hypothetical protein A2898_00905 [Candidatus Kerfeldbacteria bacterium RIFCSPLOWO2_01_FULL_48_11]HCJ52536.1 hypothetical protein [Candidatus Kerfeldbacteria bacterium]HCM68139.1 hypothetical protein [Candidatus Kerfeldbacteria bacterium]